MPKVKARVLKTKIDSGNFYAWVQFNDKLPQVNEWLTVKWGSVRSRSQNALYWAFLSWLIDHGGLKEHGHFCPEALHENLKSHFLSEKIMDRGQFKALTEATTTDLTKSDFGEYLEKVNQFVSEFFNVNTAQFWEEYQEKYSI